jgi:3-oxoadipate enol-lactonase
MIDLLARRARFAPRDEVPVAYELRTRLGSRRPWLALVQGLGFDRSGWDPVTRGLGRRFRLVLLDNRGVGASEVPPGPYTVAAMAGDVVGVLDAAGIDRAHVVGASLGGMVAQELAVEHPERVDRLVLAGTTPGWPSGYPPPPATVGLLAQVGRLPPEVALRRHVENALAPATVDRRPDLVERIVAHQRSRLPGRDGWMAQAAAGARWAGHGRQRQIRAATLVVHGTADQVVDPRNAQLLVGLIPDARLMTFPGAGHLLFWEHPERFVEVVTGFLGAGGGRGG